MAQLVVGVAGAVVGTFFGMPQLGFMVGSALGAALFPAPRQDGPRMPDLRVQQSQYGDPIAIVYGTYRVSGQIIWAADLVEHASDADSGSGGGGPTTYTYTCSFAVSMCEGPIAGVRRVWADNKLIYDATGASSSQVTDETYSSGYYYHQVEDNTIVTESTKTVMFSAGGYQIYLGDEEQLPDPTIEAGMGKGNVPAYRGQAYWVFTDMELGKYGNRIPNLTFEVVTKGTKRGVPAVPLGSGGMIEIDPTTGYIWTAWRNGGSGNPPVMGENSQVDPAIFAANSVFALVYDTNTMSLVQAIPLEGSGSDQMNVVFFGHDMYVSSEGNHYASTDVIHQINPVTYAIVGQGDTQYGGAVSDFGLLSRDRTKLYLSLTNGIGDGTVPISPDAPYIYDKTKFRANGNWVYNYAFNEYTNIQVFSSYDPLIILNSESSSTQVTVGGLLGVTNMISARFAVRTGTPFVYVASTSGRGIIMVDTQNGNIQQVVPNTPENPRALALMYSPDTDTLYVDHGPSIGVTAYNGSTFGVMETYPDSGYAQGQMLGNSIYIGNETFVVAESTSLPGGRIWVVSLHSALTAEKVQLSEIVADISNRCYMPTTRYDVHQLVPLVAGYCITHGMTGRAAIEPLAQAYFFDSVESDGKVKFVLRGSPPVMSITMSELLTQDK